MVRNAENDSSTDNGSRGIERHLDEALGVVSGWHVVVARLVGRAARWASAEAGTVADSAKKAAVTTSRVTKGLAGRMRGTPRPLEDLLREMGDVVAEHSQTGYGSLEGEPRFWKLVRQLHARGRRMRVAKEPQVGPDPGEPSTDASDVAKPEREDVVDAVSGSGAAEDSIFLPEEITEGPAGGTPSLGDGSEGTGGPRSTGEKGGK